MAAAGQTRLQALLNLLVCTLLFIPSHPAWLLLDWGTGPGYDVMLHQAGAAKIVGARGEYTAISGQQL